MTTFTLPLPPSVNGLFFNRKKVAGQKRRGRGITDKYKAWREEAGWTIKEQHVKSVRGPVALTYEIEDAGKCDLGNFEKATTDVLVANSIIDGDIREVVRKITLQWNRNIKGARITITGVGESSE